MSTEQSHACIAAEMLSDNDLLAALDGEADASVLAHLEACPCCAARAALLMRFERRLRGCLTRVLCPPTLTLIDYSLRLLDPSQQTSVAAHLHSCRACADELAQIVAERTPKYRVVQAP